ncbi:carbohydrate ABC transporter permease [Paenibacillus piri]|uniref:Sugar ABC transporter permease n=1 Tax=Paenibacillus piri TaxID=2547395 RepID=A0A4V2ZTW9_9BACL|nr:sugar ABC transporter permease [Paenibacillus piri]TDF98754.1 sugar ABC transporter permease [Paenibacillus piri]
MNTVLANERERTGKRRLSSKRRNELLISAVLLAPLVVILIIFLAWPVIWTFFLSFTNMQLTGTTAVNWSWVGFTHYINLFGDAEFFNSVRLSLIYFAGSAFLGQCVLGFFLALLLEKRLRWTRTIVGGVIILAWVIPEIVASFMWFALLSDGGVLHNILGFLHIPYETWLIEHPMLSVSLGNAWRGVAFSMLIFTAAIANIPPEMKEAAEVDGASSWRRLIYITIPMISEAILIDLVLITLGTLNNFTLIYSMTGGGPGNKTQVLSVLMYDKAFSQYQLSYGSAISVILLIIGALLSVVYMKILKKQGSQ